MSIENKEVVGYSLTLFGSTFTITAESILQIVGMLGMIVGLFLTWRGQSMRKVDQDIARERTAEMRRANDLKEKEHASSENRT